MLALPLNRTTRCRLLICLFLLTGLLGTGVGAVPASAQQPDSVEVDTTDHESSSWTVASAERKSPGRAVLYSAGGTVLLSPLLIGPLIGPSFGHFYANDNRQAWRGISLRVGGIGLVGVFGLVGLAQAQGGGVEWGFAAAQVTFYAVIIHAVYDIVTAWHSAKDYNEAHDLSARVAPTVGPQGKQMGLSLRVSF